MTLKIEFFFKIVWRFALHIHVAFATYLTAFYLTELYVRTCRIPEEAQLSSHKVNYLSQHRPAHKLGQFSDVDICYRVY